MELRQMRRLRVVLGGNGRGTAPGPLSASPPRYGQAISQSVILGGGWGVVFATGNGELQPRDGRTQFIGLGFHGGKAAGEAVDPFRFRRTEPHVRLKRAVA